MQYCKDGENYSSLRAAINSACGNNALNRDKYWSSSVSVDNSFWCYDFSLGSFKTVNLAVSNTSYVRAVFAY